MAFWKQAVCIMPPNKRWIWLKITVQIISFHFKSTKLCVIGTIALIIYSHWELLVSAFFGSVNHEWLLILTILKKIVEVKLKGGNVLTECAIIVLASLAPGAGYQICFATQLVRILMWGKHQLWKQSPVAPIVWKQWKLPILFIF